MSLFAILVPIFPIETELWLKKMNKKELMQVVHCLNTELILVSKKHNLILC